MLPPDQRIWYFTKGERTGILILVIACIAVWSVDYYLKHTPREPEPLDAATQRKIDAFLYGSSETDDAQVTAVEPFYFNPNTATQSDFEQLGLSPKAARQIINYRSKGGQFRKPEDFGRIYAVSDADYERLSPFIRLESRTNGDEQPERDQPAELFTFDPNTATQSDFERLGLSAKAAKQIVKYRSKGGQFRKPEDFGRIYAVSDADYERLSSYIRLENRDDIAGVEEREAPAELFTFDPNTATQADFEQLGLSSKTAKQIIKYRSKGGQFRKPEDFGKIYAITEADYERLSPYIQIVPQEDIAALVPKGYEEPRPERIIPPVDVNVATKADWDALPGVGPYFADKIIEWRDKLGGFYEVSQVSGAYRLPDSVYQRILPYLQLATPPTPSLRINTADVKMLAAHPYLDYKKARVIVNYRKRHGAFSSPEDLLKTKVVKAEDVARLRAYILVE